MVLLLTYILCKHSLIYSVIISFFFVKLMVLWIFLKTKSFLKMFPKKGRLNRIRKRFHFLLLLKYCFDLNIKVNTNKSNRKPNCNSFYIKYERKKFFAKKLFYKTYFLCNNIWSENFLAYQNISFRVKREFYFYSIIALFSKIQYDLSRFNWEFKLTSL